MTLGKTFNSLNLSFLTSKMGKHTHTHRAVGGLKEIIRIENMGHNSHLIIGCYDYCCWNQNQSRMPTVTLSSRPTIAGPIQGDRWAKIYPMRGDRWTKKDDQGYWME